MQCEILSRNKIYKKGRSNFIQLFETRLFNTFRSVPLKNQVLRYCILSTGCSSGRQVLCLDCVFVGDVTSSSAVRGRELRRSSCDTLSCVYQINTSCLANNCRCLLTAPPSTLSFSATSAAAVNRVIVTSHKQNSNTLTQGSRSDGGQNPKLQILLR